MAAASAQSLAPPEFLQLAGHPLRWRLLAELALSDRVVSELTARLGQPQNLVSYHLGKLRGARLVSARRSAADGRDTYYALELTRMSALLSAAGGALHPGLRLTAPNIGHLPPVRVLYLCTGNSARSQMAEALTRWLSDGAVQAASAGSHPRPLHANAVRAMREGYGLSLDGHVAKSLGRLQGERFDAIVSLCDRVREVCPDFPGDPQTLHWSLANPATDEDDETTYPAFQETADELANRIRFLLARLADPVSRPESKGERHARFA